MVNVKSWTTEQLRDYRYDNIKHINSLTTIEYEIYLAVDKELRYRAKHNAPQRSAVERIRGRQN
jgi:hypothetical protein